MSSLNKIDDEEENKNNLSKDRENIYDKNSLTLTIDSKIKEETPHNEKIIEFNDNSHIKNNNSLSDQKSPKKTIKEKELKQNKTKNSEVSSILRVMENEEVIEYPSQIAKKNHFNDKINNIQELYEKIISMESELNTTIHYESINILLSNLEKNLKVQLNLVIYRKIIFEIYTKLNLNNIDEKVFENLNFNMKKEQKLFSPTFTLKDYISHKIKDNKKICELKINKTFEFITLINNENSFIRVIGFKYLSNLFENGELKSLMNKISQETFIFSNTDLEENLSFDEEYTNFLNSYHLFDYSIISLIKALIVEKLTDKEIINFLNDEIFDSSKELNINLFENTLSYIKDIFDCNINVWEYEKEKKNFGVKSYKSKNEIKLEINILYDNDDKKFDIISDNIINKETKYCCSSCSFKKNYKK